MSKYALIEGIFLYLTPVGSYYAVSSAEDDKSRRFLKRLLSENETPPLTIDTLKELMSEDNEEKVLNLLHHCEKIGWVEGVSESIKSPSGSLEDILPNLLGSLSETDKALLGDDQGFYLACHGFAHEVAEELSVVGAEIANVHQRRSGLLMNNLGMASQAWSIVDAFGCSQIGFWPIFIGNTQFTIVISGIPHFNHPDFVTLVWALSIRYAN